MKKSRTRQTTRDSVRQGARCDDLGVIASDMQDRPDEGGKNRFVIAPDFLNSLTDLYHESATSDYKDGAFWKPYSRQPTKNHITELLEICLWGSLKMEEGRGHRFQVVYSPPEDWPDPLLFANPLPFNPESLAKLSPAIESTGTIGVRAKAEKGKPKDGELGELEIWGLIEPPVMGATDLVAAAIGPGQVLLSYREGIRARITAEKAEFFDNWENRFEHVWSPVFPEEHFVVKAQRKLDLWEIAIAMRAHGHGGILLVVPNHTEKWKRSIDQKKFELGSGYDRVTRPYARADQQLSGIVQTFESGEQSATQGDYQGMERRRQVVRFVSQLTAVDGATVVTSDLKVLAFGAEITAEKDPTYLKKWEWLGKKEPECVLFSELKGTRHKSAARFIDLQRAIAIVASEDGRLSIFRKSDDANILWLPHAEFLWWTENPGVKLTLF